MSMTPNQITTCRPSPEQELLLQAALLKGAAAVKAWHAWRSRTRPADLDAGSQRLLPLLWHNLKNQGVDPDDALMKSLRRSYRLTRGRNRLRFDAIFRQLQALHAASFPTMLLKGAALIVHYFKDYGLRPMGDFDILIPTAMTEDAVEFLRKTGWQPAPRRPEAFTAAYRRITHAHAFNNSQGWEFDLHWHVLEECCRPDADEDFWDAAVRTEVAGVPTALLNPADQLLHICVHGMRWNDIPPLRWVADAITVLNASPDSLDWERLLMQVEKRRLMIPVKAALDYLRTLLDAPIPSYFISRLDRLPTSITERFEYRLKTRPYRHKALGYLPILWCSHCRLSSDMSLAATVCRFIPFIQQFWGIEHFRQLPRLLILMSAQRAREVLRNTR